MEQTDADLWSQVQIDPTHLTEEEIKHECTIRAVYFPGLALVAQQAQLKHSFAQEQASQQDVIEMFKASEDSETLQADFNALLDTIAAQSSQFFSAVASPDFVAPVLMSRLKHYTLRLQRFPSEQFDSDASVNTRKLFNDLARIVSKLQRPQVETAVVNELIDGLSTDTPMNSTTIPNEQTARTVGVPPEQAQSMNTVCGNVPLAHPTRDPEQIQTTESFRMSPQFHTLANQPTPPCQRGVPLSVHFRQTPENVMSYSQMHIRSPQTDWSFRTHELPHSTRTATATVTSTHTQPTATRHQVDSNVAQPNYHNLANTVRLMPTELSTLHSSDPASGASRSFSDSYIRQAGSELQALKRWLGTKTFEGEIVDTKHFSIDEFLSNLQLCMQSGICSEQTMLRNLAPAFSGRAFKWWTTTHGRIQSFNQLAQSLKLRFATYAGSVEGLMSAIYGRRQQKHESLPDFVDTMQQLMDQLPDNFNDLQRISTIISCALPDDARLLRSRHYTDVTDFTRHVAFLSQDKPKHSVERQERRSNRDKPVFTCEVSQKESDSSSDESDASTQADVQAITAAFQKSLAGLKFKRHPKFDPKKAKMLTDGHAKSGEKLKQSTEQTGPNSKFRCFGCEAPGVYFANCQVCQSKDKQKRDIFCFGCGAPDVYFTNCETCQSKKAKNESPALDSATNRATAN